MGLSKKSKSDFCKAFISDADLQSRITNKANIMRLISDYILDDIEKSLGLDVLDRGEREATMKEIVVLISSRAGLRIMKEFSEEEAREFNAIPEEDFEEMESYILSKNPDAKAIFEEEARRVKEDILRIRG